MNAGVTCNQTQKLNPSVFEARMSCCNISKTLSFSGIADPNTEEVADANEASFVMEVDGNMPGEDAVSEDVSFFY